MPSKPTNMQQQAIASKILYPYLSHMGPKSNEPASIPNGNIEKSAPAATWSSWYFSCRSCTTDPSVIRLIPKNNIPVQAAAKIIFLLYIIYTAYCLLPEL